MPIVNIKKTGENITKMREKAGFTVKEVQDVFGFRTPQAIYKWQNGICLPTLDNMVILADIFQCKIDDIIVVEKMEA